MIKNSNEQTLKEAINELLKAYNLNNGLNETRLINSWEKVAGNLISKHTSNLYIRNRKLYVLIDSSALKHELGFAKTKLVNALNKKAKEQVIDEIIFL